VRFELLRSPPQPVGGWCDGRPLSAERVVVGEQQLPAVAVRVAGVRQVGGSRNGRVLSGKFIHLWSNTPHHTDDARLYGEFCPPNLDVGFFDIFSSHPSD